VYFIEQLGTGHQINDENKRTFFVQECLGAGVAQSL